MKLIQTKDCLLLIDEEAEIKENTNTFKEGINGDWYWNSIYDFVRNHGDTSDFDFKVIAYYPLTKEAKELDLPLLPNLFKEDTGVEKLAQEVYREYPTNPKDKPDWTYNRDIHVHKKRKAFIKGYKAAQSKQFSLEDIIAFGKKCFYKGFDKSENDDANSFTAWREERSKLIQSLSTQQLPKEFIPEYRYYYHSSKEFYSDAGFVECSKEQYESIKVEIPTCPLKAEIKTIINSEGKEELVGTYKY